MIEGLKPYPEYQESGSPWLGRYPAHWDLPRLGAVLRERGETNEARQMDQVLSVMKDIGVIPYEEKGRVGNKKSEDTARYKIVRPDDIVVNCMNVIIGSVGLSRYTGCLSPVYYVLTRRSDDDNPRYLNAVFLTKPFQLNLVRIGNGILAHRMRIPMELLKCEPFPKPPSDEQDAIVRFLDHANGRIERAIRAKKKLIALLNEQKQAIINRAVAHGLQPNIRLKPSGIAWLGDVPEHWEVMQLRQVLSFGPKNGVSPNAPNAGGVLSFSISAVRNGQVQIEGNEKRVDLDRALLPGLRIRKGDILLVRGNGNVALVGKCGLVDRCPDDCVYPDILMKIRPNERVRSEFLVSAVNSAYVSSQVSTLAKTANGAFKVSGSTVRSLLVAVPPLPEQETITDSLRNHVGAVDFAIARTEREIGLLREYRTRLTADVVTGKLNVREAARLLITEETVVSEPAELEHDGVEEMESEDACA